MVVMISMHTNCFRNYVTALRVILASAEEDHKLEDVLSEIPLSKQNEQRVWQYIIQEFQKFYDEYQTSIEVRMKEFVG